MLLSADSQRSDRGDVELLESRESRFKGLSRELFVLSDVHLTASCYQLMRDAIGSVVTHIQRFIQTSHALQAYTV